MGAVLALCEFSLLISEHNHSDLSLTALDGALKPLNKGKGAFWALKMSKSVTAKVGTQLVRYSHQLQKQMVYEICAVIDTLVYGDK